MLVTQIGVEDIDQDVRVLRTRYFNTYITLSEAKPVRIYLFYRDPNMRGDFFGGDSTFKEEARVQFWEVSLVTPPEQGARPREWPLAVTGEFPSDKYSLNFLIGLNATTKFSDVTIDIRLTDTLRRKWNVSREFFPVKATSDSFSALQVDYGKFKYEIDKCADFYGLRVVFSRTQGEIERFNVYWYIAVGLLGVLAVALFLFRRLNLEVVITLGVGIFGIAAERCVSLTNDPTFPRTRWQLIESLYVGILLFAIVWLIAAIFLKTREKRGFPPLDVKLWRDLITPDGPQQASLPHVGTLFINHSEKSLKLKVVATVFLGNEEIDGVTGDVHGYYSGRTPMEMLPNWEFWGNFGIQDRCVTSSEVLRVQLDIEAVDELGKKYKTLHFCYTYDRNRKEWFLEPTRCKDLIRKGEHALRE